MLSSLCQLGGLLSRRIDFEIVCPNTHNQTVAFTEEEFEETLKADDMVFHCNTCETNLTPTKQQLADFRKQFAKDNDKSH